MSVAPPFGRCAAGIVMALALAAPTNAAKPFDLQGHRGARGLRPENTLPAFAWALNIGVGTLELDVGISADGVPVVSHDRRLMPHLARRDGTWLTQPGPTLSSLPLAELERYDVGRLNPAAAYARQFPDQQPADGARIPTLAAVVALAGRANNNSIRFNIETKLDPTAPDETPAPEAFAAAILAVLNTAGVAARATIQSFDWRTLMATRALAPAMPTSCLTIEQRDFDTIQRGRPGASPWTAGLDIDDFGGSTPRLAEAAGCQEWSAFHRDLTPAAVAEAKARGLRVLAWTVNDPAAMARLIDLGVDGIITDYPDRLRRVMATKGLPLPAATPVSP